MTKRKNHSREFKAKVAPETIRKMLSWRLSNSMDADFCVEKTLA
jgi:hypothetical protein